MVIAAVGAVYYFAARREIDLALQQGGDSEPAGAPS
jgi:hypothetical protein